MTIRRRASMSLALVALLSLAACAPTTVSSPVRTETAGSSAPAGAELDQVWATAPLVDVATGETFRIAELVDTVVIVETMAIWCTNCRFQQASVEQALTQLPQGRVTYVILDVDPNEDAASLAAYRTQHGYTGRYAIASAEVARSLADAFGDQFLSPPSTPMVIVGEDGIVTRTDFGQKGSDEIVRLALAGGA